MRKALTILNFALLFAAGPALADKDCFVPMADWQPRETVAALAQQNNWTVRRIKIDDGCYAIYGTDAQGRAIEVKLHPATLAVLSIHYGENDDHVKVDEKSGHD